jgi:hypothetical protein
MSVRAAALVAALAAATWIASRDLVTIPIPSLYTGYQPADPLVAQLVEPVLRAPWVGAVSWVFAALLALCLATEAWLLSIAYGAAGPAAAAVVIVTMASAPWTASVRHGGGLAIALALSWLAWMFILRSGPAGRESRRSGLPGREGGWLVFAGLLSWIAAIAASWLALLTAPMLLAGLTIGARRKRVRSAFVVAGALAAIVGLALYCARIAYVTTALTVSGMPVVFALDVLPVLFDPTHRPGMPAGGDLGVASLLVIALAALGAAGATTRRRWRGGVIVSALCGACIALGWPLWRMAVVHLVLWLATPFVAVGLTIVARSLAPRRQAIATAIAGALLIVVTVTNRFTFQVARDRSPSDPLGPVLGSLVSDSALFVVEDLDVDAALVAAHGSRTAGWRIAQEPAYVSQQVDEGRTVLAGPVARRHLELAGFRFQHLTGGVPSGTFTASKVTEQLHCVVIRSDRWSLLPGLEYTGRLGVEIPGGPGGAMTLVVGDEDRPPLVVTDARGNVQKVRIEQLLAAPSVDAPPPDYWFDGGDPARAPSQVFRVVLPARPAAPTLLDLALGRRAPRVLARLTGFDESARGRVCAAPLEAPELWLDPAAPREVIVPLSAATMLTAGWYGVEGEAPGDAYRWTDRVAVALIASARRVPVRIVLDAEPATTNDELLTLGLVVNSVEQPAHAMRDGPQRYEWQIPASVWLAGTNELAFSVSRVLRPIDVGGQDARVLGMKVTRLVLTRVDE